MRILRVLTIFIMMLALSGCSGENEGLAEALPESETDINLESAGNEPEAVPAMSRMTIGDDMPVSRGLAVKMLSMVLDDKDGIIALDREVPYIDSSESDWYDKYINSARLTGIIDDAGDYFYPEEYLTIAQAQALILNFYPDSVKKMKITDDNRDKAISYALWCDLYKSCLDEMAEGKSLEEVFGISSEDIVVLAEASNNVNLPQGYVISDNGLYGAEGMSFGQYIDKAVNILSKDGEIICVLSAREDKPRIKGAYVTGHENGKLTVFIGGAERTYNYSGEFVFDTGAVCDFTLDNNTAADINIYSESVSDTVKLVRDEYLETASRGIIPVAEDFRIYDITGPVKWREIGHIIVGTEARIIMDNGTAKAALTEKVEVPSNIRVAIKDTGFNSFIHKNVIISAESEIKAEEKISGETKVYAPGEEIHFSNPAEFPERVYITASSGKITVNSIERNYGNPEYRGIIEIAVEDGGFTIVNEVNMEEYLYSVVPSEMPTSYGLEALMTQAVTARSYAYNQYYANTYHEFGANVCDSVNSQVYNNIEENDASIQAVDKTKGMCLSYNGEVISANFFSTSAGVTADNGEVWADGRTKSFPSETSPYLSGKIQYLKADYGDLSIEENMSKFIKDEAVEAYDSESPWFRWYAELTGSQISASINAHLEQRYNANPKLIKTLQPDGIFRSRPVTSIGELINLEIVKRGRSGNIMTMKITGTENTVLVSSEYNIRTLIKPKNYTEGGEAVNIRLSNGTEMTDYDIMPSAFYAMERMTDGDGRIIYVKFFGGGNGHGAGMSQTGVKGMVDAGFTFNEILEHYYEGTEVKQMW